MLKKKKPKVKVEESPDKKDGDDDGNSSARKKKSPKKKGPQPNILRGIASNKDLEMKEDGTVPKVIVKENNMAVDLLKQADDKLKRVLEMYVPPKGSGSEKSKTSSRRSKSSTSTIKQKPAAAQIIKPIV
jgi:hypothetical protein